MTPPSCKGSGAGFFNADRNVDYKMAFDPPVNGQGLDSSLPSSQLSDQLENRPNWYDARPFRLQMDQSPDGQVPIDMDSDGWAELLVTLNIVPLVPAGGVNSGVFLSPGQSPRSCCICSRSS